MTLPGLVLSKVFRRSERVFIEWLGPTSRRAWAEIESMWEGKHSLMDVVRAERSASQKTGGSFGNNGPTLDAAERAQ